MDLDLTPDQEELRASIRAVLAQESPPSLARTVVEGRSHEPAEKLWARQVELDWPALTVPEAYGGIGLGPVELAILAEELGRAIAPGPLLATVSQFVPAAREMGTPDQREHFLGLVARGSLRGTVAVEGPGFTARPSDDGAGWVLDGASEFVVEAGGVDEIIVTASMSHGAAAFVVPAAAAGVTSVLSMEASRRYGRVELQGVTVDRERRLGNGGDASTAFARAVEEATAALAMETVGTCRAIFDLALDHAKSREQFGVAIGSFQALKHKFADMLVALERARTCCYFAALTIAEDDPRRTLAVSMAKAAAGDCQRLVAQEGIQILGGVGYTWEHDMHLYVKRAKAGDALFGTAAEHRQRVADLLGL